MNAKRIIYTDSDRIKILPKPLTSNCIVLDLDLTLLSTQEDLQKFQDLKIHTDSKLIKLRQRSYYLHMDDYEYGGIGSVYTYWGVLRPYTKDFLKFCFSYFNVVAVWSAGKRRYVEGIVDFIFEGLPAPHIVFTYDDIERGDVIVKPLTKMINYNEFTRKNMSLNNIFVLDDNVTTFGKNKNNAIHIPEYEPKMTIADMMSMKDIALVQFMYWLSIESVMSSKNVRKLDKSHIFSTSIKTYIAAK